MALCGAGAGQEAGRLGPGRRNDVAAGHGHADRVDAVDRVHVAGLAAPRNSSAFRSTAIRRDRVGERDHVAAGHVRPAWVTAGFAVQVDAVLAEQCPEHGVVLMDEPAALDADAQLRLAGGMPGEYPGVARFPLQPVC